MIVLNDIKQIVAAGGGLLLILMTVVQVTPIKLNPWSWVARTIGRAINGEVLAKMDKLDKDLENHKKKSEERHAVLCRAHILRFGDEILHGQLHSKEHYQQILLDVDSYEAYCDKHKDFKNNVAVATIKLIKKTYLRHLEEDSFL